MADSLSFIACVGGLGELARVIAGGVDCRNHCVWFRPFVVQAFYIPSRSMENTLLINDHIFVNKFIYRMTTPERWDVIVFRYPNDPSRDYIKRLVGLPGDTVAVQNGRLIINGTEIKRSYLESEVSVRFKGLPVDENVRRNIRTMRFSGDGLMVNQKSLFEGSHNPVRARARVSRIYREAGDHSVKLIYRNGKRSTSFGPIHVPKPGDVIHLNKLERPERQYYYNLMKQVP
ncbi:MAG: signal peptidase I [bacterium]